MNTASSPTLSPDHQRLQALVGAWHGEEEISATQWAPAGSATAEVTAQAEFGGLFVMQRYRQARDGKTSFASHNIFGVDQPNATCTMHQFDTMGFVPAEPATGTWGDTGLALVKSSPRGAARTTYRFDTPDSYRMRLEFKAAGSDIWQDRVNGVYRRVSPSSITLS